MYPRVGKELFCVSARSLIFKVIVLQVQFPAFALFFGGAEFGFSHEKGVFTLCKLESFPFFPGPFAAFWPAVPSEFQEDVSKGQLALQCLRCPAGRFSLGGGQYLDGSVGDWGKPWPAGERPCGREVLRVPCRVVVKGNQRESQPCWGAPCFETNPEFAE